MRAKLWLSAGAAAAFVLVPARTHADPFMDELRNCNSDNGMKAFQRCLDAAAAREDERRHQRQIERQWEAEAKAEKTKAARAAYAAKVKATAAARAGLASEYRHFLEQAFPEHNFIKVVTQDQGNGFHLLGIHPLFGRYTLSIGAAGRRVQEWAGTNRPRLMAAHINAVGVQSDRGDSVFFDLR